MQRRKKSRAREHDSKFASNLWSAGAEKVFSQEEVEAVRFLSVDKTVNCQKQIIETIRRKYEILDGDRYLEDENLEFWDRGQKIADMESRLWPVEDVYKLHAINGVSAMAETAALDRLSDIYDTDWAIIGGIDRADPTKGKRTAARTVFTYLACFDDRGFCSGDWLVLFNGQREICSRILYVESLSGRFCPWNQRTANPLRRQTRLIGKEKRD